MLLALAGAVLPASVAAGDIPIAGAGAWKLVQHAPPMPDPACFARIEGPDLNTSLLLTRAGAPVISLGRGNEWSFQVQDASITASVDGGPPIPLKATLGINLVLIPPSPDLMQQLHHAKAIDWTLPFGHFRGQVAGYDAALAAVTACVSQRDHSGSPPSAGAQ